MQKKNGFKNAKKMVQNEWDGWSMGPDWKINTNQAHSCSRGDRLSAPWESSN